MRNIKTFPNLAELAELEWQLVEVFDQADSTIAKYADINQFAAEHWPLQKIKLHISVIWMNTHWNIIDIYRAFRTETEMSKLYLLKIPQQYLLWRKQYLPQYRVITAREWLLLKKWKTIILLKCFNHWQNWKKRRQRRFSCSHLFKITALGWFNRIRLHQTTR